MNFRVRRVNKIFKKSRCYNGGNRHKFESRYDEEPNVEIIHQASRIRVGGDIREVLVLNKYVKDVCIWCGKEIKK